jgi:hypothetical protein
VGYQTGNYAYIYWQETGYSCEGHPGKSKWQSYLESPGGFTFSAYQWWTSWTGNGEHTIWEDYYGISPWLGGFNGSGSASAHQTAEFCVFMAVNDGFGTLKSKANWQYESLSVLNGKCGSFDWHYPYVEACYTTYYQRQNWTGDRIKYTANIYYDADVPKTDKKADKKHEVILWQGIRDGAGTGNSPDPSGCNPDRGYRMRYNPKSYKTVEYGLHTGEEDKEKHVEISFELCNTRNTSTWPAYSTFGQNWFHVDTDTKKIESKPTEGRYLDLHNLTLIRLSKQYAKKMAGLEHIPDEEILFN